MEYLDPQVGAGARLQADERAVGVHDNHISVRFEYECRDADGQWWRSHGNEHWEFDELGYMRRRDASINDLKIDERSGATARAGSRGSGGA